MADSCIKRINQNKKYKLFVKQTESYNIQQKTYIIKFIEISFMWVA